MHAGRQLAHGREGRRPQPPPIFFAQQLRVQAVGIVQRAMHAGRQLAHGREGRAHGDVDGRAVVDGPARGVQQGAQAAAAQLEPGQEHGRPGNADKKDQQSHRPPPAQGEDGIGDVGEGRADHTDAHAEGCEDARALGEIKARLGRRAGGRGRGVGLDVLVQRGDGLAGCLAQGVVLGGHQFLQLVGHQIAETYVRGPHGFAQADGIAHQAEHAGVPVPSRIVHEYAVAALNKGGGAARRQGGGDDAGLFLAVAVRAAALAVDQAEVALRGQTHVGVQVRHRHAEKAGAAVQIECARQEDGPPLRVVKIREGHKIHQQGIEMDVQQGQFFQVAHRGHARRGQIPPHISGKGLLHLAVEQGVQLGGGEFVQGLFRSRGQKSALQGIVLPGQSQGRQAGKIHAFGVVRRPLITGLPGQQFGIGREALLNGAPVLFTQTFGRDVRSGCSGRIGLIRRWNRTAALALAGRGCVDQRGQQLAESAQIVIPGRIDAVRQGQGLVRSHPGQGQTGQSFQ